MNNIAKEFASMREMLQQTAQKVDNYAANRINATDDSVTDTQVALAETYEETYEAITDIQVALADVYETMLGGI